MHDGRQKAFPRVLEVAVEPSKGCGNKEYEALASNNFGPGKGQKLLPHPQDCSPAQSLRIPSQDASSRHPSPRLGMRAGGQVLIEAWFEQQRPGG